MILIGRGLVLADDLVDDFSFEGASPSSGDDSQVVTPVPMPNTEVKHLNAESSWGLPPVRIGRCQANGGSGAYAQGPPLFYGLFLVFSYI